MIMITAWQSELFVSVVKVQIWRKEEGKKSWKKWQIVISPLKEFLPKDQGFAGSIVGIYFAFNLSAMTFLFISPGISNVVFSCLGSDQYVSTCMEEMER